MAFSLCPPVDTSRRRFARRSKNFRRHRVRLPMHSAVLSTLQGFPLLCSLFGSPSVRDFCAPYIDTVEKQVSGLKHKRIWTSQKVMSALFETRLRRRAHRVKPATDVYLGMSFAAVVSRSGPVGGVRIPSVHRKIGISTSNHKPVGGIRGNESTDFTPEFLKCCHALSSSDQ